MENTKGLKKSLGLVQLTYYATGMILGAGIYSIIGKAAGVAGAGLWLSFIIAGISALLTALSYAELATLYPKAGAEYVYLKNIFPNFRFLSFLCGTLMVFAAVATSATVALSFAGYLDHFLNIPHFWVAAGLLLLFTLINILGVREAAWMNILFTSIETIGLLIFIYIGLQKPEFGEVLSSPLNWTVVSGASLIFFAYLGFENMVNLAEEAKDPSRNIPRAIIISIVFTTVVYIFVGLAALALMSPQELGKSSAVLSAAVSKESPKMASALGGIALFATGNTVMIALLAGSRILLGMSRGRDLSAVFQKILPKRQTPWLASIFIFLLSCGFLLLERIELVASISSLVTIIVFIVINFAVIYLRRTQPQLKRPFQVPVNIAGWPVLPFMALAMSVIFIFHFESQVYTISAGIIIFILIIYFLRRKTNMPQQGLS
ncbi:APC family permease [Bdellovibrio sp. HCB2-146]|uniref:APC family permease n=1 Tax=Bdellovibrio sp. HCB2-146 TaxID=3394362 RepID=UPI0039BD04E0